MLTTKVTNVVFLLRYGKLQASCFHPPLDLLPFVSEPSTASRMGKLPRSTSYPTQAAGTEILCLPSYISDSKQPPFALAFSFGPRQLTGCEDNDPVKQQPLLSSTCTSRVDAVSEVSTYPPT